MMRRMQPKLLAPLLFSTLLLVACQPSQTNNPSPAPIGSTIFEGGVSTTELVDGGVSISIVGDYSVRKNDEENRRGSFVSYTISAKGGDPLLEFGEIQFFSEESIRDYTAKCKEVGECFHGDYPDLKRYADQKAALAAKKSIGKYTYKKFGNRDWLVSTFGCDGDAFCAIREYTTFMRNSKVDVWIMMGVEPKEGEDIIRIAKDKEADALFATLALN